MAYSVPFNSSPPSTPDTNRGIKARGGNLFSAKPSGPSTTPAGPPPPSSAGSFTPVGSPPSTILGSSQLGSQKPLFRSRLNGKPAQSSPLAADPSMISEPSLFINRAGISKVQNKSGFFANTQQSQLSNEQAIENEQEAYAGREDTLASDLGLSDHGMELDPGNNNLQADGTASASDSIYDWGQHGASMRSLKSSKLRRGPRASRLIDRPRNSYSALYSSHALRSKEQPSALSTLAKSTAQQLGTAELNEPHSLILGTEKEIRRIYPDGNHQQDQDELLEAALRVVPDTLARAWQRCCREDDNDSDIEGEINFQVGPNDDLPAYHKASFIGNLLLKLYHPPPARGKQAVPAFRASRQALVRSDDNHREEAYPQVLFDWLNENHNPYSDIMRTLGSHQPNPTAHPSFWDLVLSFTLRGRLSDVIRLLNRAKFEHARSAAEDGFGREGYSAQVLNTIDREVQRAVQTLASCPGVTEDDWNLASFAWGEYRMKIEAALEQLIATSERVGTEPRESAFDASKITLRSSVSEFTRSTKQPEVKMPRTVFRNLRQLYNILLGRTNELLAAAADWIEATLALTAWWDGEDDEEAIYTLSSGGPTRHVDADPGAAYRKRLYSAFERATGAGDGLGDTWQIDSNSPVEIALASVCENNLSGVFDLLKSFSLPIASAIIEIGTRALWYHPATASRKVDELDKSDLMVLSYSQPETPISKSEFLSVYADHLFEISILEWNETEKEGWELAIEILSRMDDVSLADKKIGELISRIDVESDQRADKLISLCRLFNLDSEANKVSEKYADHVAENTNRYGTALIYYARAANTKKVRDVLALLISYCLVQSTSFPPMEMLDPHLSSLISKPRESLLWLANIDAPAAEILSLNMSGYATLRKFYDTRDEASDVKPLSFNRKRTAAAALLMVISSASSSIHGGIYDPESDAIVPFDVLLVLLGEAMPLVDTHARYLSLRQLMVLLRAIEDLQTVHPRIRTQCEECLKSTLASRSGAAHLADPQAMLKKSISGLTGSSGFSIIGDSTETESWKDLQKSTEGLHRGWDWRDALEPGSGSDEIIGMLRLGLAREVSRAWLDGEELQ